jgi:hypothetical protein
MPALVAGMIVFARAQTKSRASPAIPLDGD